MIRLRHKFLIILFKWLDQFSLVLALGLAIYFLDAEFNSTNLTKFLATNIKAQNVVGMGVMIAVWSVLFHLTVRYDANRFTSPWSQITDLFRAISIACFFLWIGAFAFDFEVITPWVLLGFWSISIILGAFSRLLLRRMLKAVRKSGHNKRHILFVGTDDKALDFAKKIEAREELGYEISGFVSNERQSAARVTAKGYKVLGELMDLQRLFADKVIDEIMISLSVRDNFQDIVNVVNWCQDQGVVVRFIPGLFDFRILTTTQIEQFDGEYIVTFFRENLLWQLFFKRFVDLLLVFMALPILLPLFAIISILIKVTSPGPVFFIQERVGMNKRRFDLYKFRTMVANAEAMKKDLEHLNEVTGPVFKIKNDPRITSIGRYLRKFSLDELPQLINVFKGEMSLVGPRPPLVSEVDKYEWMDRKRLSIRPGITCLWQISGRSNLDFDEWMELDRQYIDNWSFWLDVKILLKTIPVVIKGTGAS